MFSALGKIYLRTRGVIPTRTYPNEDTEDEEIIFLLRQSLRMNIRSRAVVEILMGAHPSPMPRHFWEIRPHNPNSPTFLRVLSWNLLAHALVVPSSTPPETDKALQWRVRRYYHLQEIIQHQPDVICLQEVDHFRFMNAALMTAGYFGQFLRNPNSLCLRMPGNNGPDGLAIFYSTEKFSRATWCTKRLTAWGRTTDQIALGVTLRTRTNNMDVFFAVTHLKAPTSRVMKTIRDKQGLCFLEWAEQEAHNCPIVLCGSFNGDPHDSIYRRTMRHRLNLQSAYRMKGIEPEYTKWTKIGDVEEKKCVDYIFHSKSFLAMKVLGLPRPDVIPRRRFPNEEYPSDHLALMADFEVNVRYRGINQALRESAL